MKQLISTTLLLLIELQPKWLTENLFIFLCPHCQQIWLSCKNIVMSATEQRRIFEQEFGNDWNEKVVASRGNHAWKFQPDSPSFVNLTITPSIDASDSGHWHGFITNGQIL